MGLLAVALWSTVATAFKIALRYLDPFQLLLYASLFSALLLLAIVVQRGHCGLLWKYLREKPGFYLMAAALNPCIYYLVLFSAYALLPAQQAQAINFSWAITLGLMAVFVLGQRLRRKDVVATVLGYGGVLIIATGGDLTSLRVESPRGVLLALSSTVVWAWYWLCNARNPNDPVVSLCLNFLLAVPACLLLCVIFSSPAPIVRQGLAAAAYVGLFEMGITFVLWSLALRKTSHISRIANLIFLAPLFSLVLIHNILGETVQYATLVGLSLIIPGCVLQQWGRQQR